MIVFCINTATIARGKIQQLHQHFQGHDSHNKIILSKLLPKLRYWLTPFTIDSEE
jgi:hypothetical protein